MREAHNVSGEHRDIATASLVEASIDETERRTGFLSEACRVSQGFPTGHVRVSRYHGDPSLRKSSRAA